MLVLDAMVGVLALIVGGLRERLGEASRLSSPVMNNIVCHFSLSYTALQVMT